jgi:hypothetical protein
MNHPDSASEARALLTRLREDREALDKAITGLEGVLPYLEHGSAASASPPKTGKGGPSGFEPKYDKSSSEYFIEVLTQAGRRMALPEVERELKRRDIEFHRETLSYAARSLEGKGRIKKIKAPPESSFQWFYELGKEASS